MNREAHDPTCTECAAHCPAEGTSYVHRAHVPSTNQQSAPKLTSTAACRIFVGQADAIISELAFEKISETDAWQSFDYAIGSLCRALAAAFRRRVETVRPGGELAQLDDQTPAEAPAATEPP